MQRVQHVQALPRWNKRPLDHRARMILSLKPACTVLNFRENPKQVLLRPIRRGHEVRGEEGDGQGQIGFKTGANISQLHSAAHGQFANMGLQHRISWLLLGLLGPTIGLKFDGKTVTS